MRRGVTMFDVLTRDAKRQRATRAKLPSKLVEGSAYVVPELAPGKLAGAIVIPLRTKSETNAHESWRLRCRRASDQRMVTAAWLNQLGAAEWRTRIGGVCFVRLAPKPLDQGDNLCSSSKFVRDQVAAWIAGENHVKGRGNDGATSGIHWDQDHQDASDHYGVRVEFYLREISMAADDVTRVAGPNPTPSAAACFGDEP